MIRKEKEGIIWLEFESLQEHSEVVHGVFLRHGGVSKGSYDSLNLGGGTHDDEKLIEKNRSLIQNILKLPKLIAGKQVHGVHLECFPSLTTDLEIGCDGLITNERGIGLLIKHSDCQAAIFYDPIKQVIANVHCGWRGNVQNIYHQTVLRMQQVYRSNPRDLLVCVSPSLGPHHAEFKNFTSELPELFYPFQIKPTYFDLWAISRMQLEEAGVMSHHIEIAQICTFDRQNDYYSYRRDKITGRNGTIAALKEM